jgi:hypothetical protein
MEEFQPFHVLLAVSRAQEESPLARAEWFRRVALGINRLVHLDDPPKIEIVGEPLQLL